MGASINDIFRHYLNAETLADFVHNVVWSADAYQEMLRCLEGAEATPLDLTTAVCRTIDAVPLDPLEMAAKTSQ